MPNECTPFLKWAGGKRKITSLLQEAFPEEFFSAQGRFFEPFVGGGALALSLGNREGSKHVSGTRISINDMNPDLVTTYEAIRDDLPALINKLDEIKKEFEQLPRPDQEPANNSVSEEVSIKNRADYFYQVRATEPDNKIDTAARLIFLNKTCFNGLWRVNSKGKFNVPYGHHKNPSLYDKANLEECNRRIQGASITHSEFYEAVSTAKSGDLVYFDPPYIPLNITSSFSQYSKNDFGINEQEALAKTIEELTAKGVYVILSNSDTPLTREIFGGTLKLRRILMSRFISASAEKRNAVYEVIGTNFEMDKDSALSKLDLI